MHVVSALKDAVLNAAFPQSCHVCSDKVHESGFGVACSTCWSQTNFLIPSRLRCFKCGVVSDAPKLISSDCPFCRDHDYDLARSMGVYEKAMTAAILHLKSVPIIPKIILDQLPRALSSEDLADVDIIVPVPLSKRRRLERGFNQAETVALAISRVLAIPVDSASLVRKKHTPMHRAAMDRKARTMAVENAFEVRRPKLIEDRSILLVDDIFTSGATASFCAKVLKKKGAAVVKVFTLARAVR